MAAGRRSIRIRPIRMDLHTGTDTADLVIWYKKIFIYVRFRRIFDLDFSLGQITSRGLFESYILGQFFKNYYVNFLTPSYNPTRVHVRSLDSDSSLMGAMSFMSGEKLLNKLLNIFIPLKMRLFTQSFQ